MKNILLALSVALFLNSCASSTERGEIGLDRKQLLLVPNSMVIEQSAAAYVATKEEAKKKNQLDQNPAQVKRINDIAKKLIPYTAIFRKEAPAWAWEVHVISAPDVNAYCMPGGKIMFYTGILETLKMTDGEVAAVMGHEIAHALREHGRERMTEEYLKMGVLQGLLMTGKLDEKYAGIAVQAANVAVSLPHGRRHESEADDIGVELMARAGYDPHEAINLWSKMSKLGGAKPPAILSTHPADGARMKAIEALLPKVMPLYETAKQVQ